jgi:hypothetical protein
VQAIRRIPCLPPGTEGVGRQEQSGLFLRLALLLSAIRAIGGDTAKMKATVLRNFIRRNDRAVVAYALEGSRSVS